jgi:hypothetical protein
MNRRTAPALLASLLVLVACQAATTASPTPSASASASSYVPSASEESGGSPVSSIDPAPSDDLGPFSCELPVVEAATEPPPVNIVDVRVGTHDDYDRVVVEFDSGIPEYTVDQAEPPFTEDGSGFPIDVEGESFLVLVMRGGTKQTDTGESSYDGPTDFDPGLAQLVDLVEGGDFEAQSTWYFGLTGDACTRVFTLTEPDRLVIDIEH